ncbi:hypothetical protein E4U19_001590 [Claviceps sp. Clav32 group G5]|nr:hypothetical protein E4U19_001590 [Claviceps sp. Clav32 group G5]KAG6031916.1 hypothetical protein E4U40_006720 [Claviceps sp. LM458 group G5]KAG6045463.1 hypothetical protein E4U39_002365 [Claviceps sp. Clav50 group G5]
MMVVAAWRGVVAARAALAFCCTEAAWKRSCVAARACSAGSGLTETGWTWGEARQTAGSGISSDSRADVDGKEEVESEGMLLLRNSRRHGRKDGMDELGEPDRRL